MRNRKYILDPSDLQYKLIRLPWKKRLFRAFLWFAVSIGVSVIYLTVFENYFGSPKERKFTQDIERTKLMYSLLDRKYENAFKTIDYLRLSDEERFRPILDMDSLPESFRKPGYGGVDRYRDLEGLSTSSILISAHQKLDNLNNMANVQVESFKSIDEKSIEQKREMDHMPWMSPVNVKFRLGDPFKFRQIHPVLGIPQMHWGQDFCVPYGTEVFATGDGTVIESGRTSGGFGNCVVIDHGYGLQSTYGHLSEIRVPKGMNVKRGDLIGLSGSTGQSTGPHLHYQIDKFGQHVNPIYYFNNDLTSEQYNEMIQAFASKSKFR
jgi:murein DD-endopeptidase MepM/ murein hydrolase activator NlpD